MSMDISGIVARLPALDDAALKRIEVNISVYLDSGDPKKIDAAEKLARSVGEERSRRHLVSAEAEEATRREMQKKQPDERVLAAFTEVPPTETDLKVIRVLLENPNQTSASLSRMLGWRGQIWHTHFGLMCRAREAWLWPAKGSVVRDAKFYSGILAEFSKDRRWTARPETEGALRKVMGGLA